jgi:hypothetical protein
MLKWQSNDIIVQIGVYKVINEPIKIIWIKAQLNNFLTYIWRKKIHQKMIMIWTFENEVHFKTFKSSLFFMG